MATLATAGALVRVTPWDDLQFWAGPESPWDLIADRTPFVFRVEGWLEDGHIRYGLHGPLVDGPQRYHGLWCSIITRADGSDWRVESSSSANFKVGPSVVSRDHRHDFRHPEGTALEGYPRLSRFGAVEVVRSQPSKTTATELPDDDDVSPEAIVKRLSFLDRVPPGMTQASLAEWDRVRAEEKARILANWRRLP